MSIAAFLTEPALKAFSPAAEKYRLGIVEGCDHYQIDTKMAVAHFLAQIAHESGHFRHVREIWGPTPAQARYDGRADLGNTKLEARRHAQAKGMGTGKFYAGHGLLQITGYTNHLAYGRSVYGDDRCAAQPTLLELPKDAAKSACWFFAEYRPACLKWARADSVVRVTKLINGGTNGLPERTMLLDRAKRILGVSA